MKKKIKIITLITLLCFVFTIPVFAAVNWDKEPKNYDVRVFVDSKDNELTFPAGMGKPFIAEGRTFTPYRIMCESLGAKVDWNEGARKVTAEGNNSKVELFIGNSNYKVNGKNRVMDVEPFILKAEGRTYIPARYLVEGLNYTIDFAQDGKVMYICSFTQGQTEAERKAALNEIVKVNQKPVVQPPVEKPITEQPVVKKKEIDTSKYTTKTKLDGFPEFYLVDVQPGAIGFESNDKHRFVCTSHPGLNEYKGTAMIGGEYAGRSDELGNMFFISTTRRYATKLEKGMVLEYDVFNEAGDKIYDLTIKF